MGTRENGNINDASGIVDTYNSRTVYAGGNDSKTEFGMFIQTSGGGGNGCRI